MSTCGPCRTSPWVSIAVRLHSISTRLTWTFRLPPSPVVGCRWPSYAVGWPGWLQSASLASEQIRSGHHASMLHGAPRQGKAQATEPFRADQRQVPSHIPSAAGVRYRRLCHTALKLHMPLTRAHTRIARLPEGRIMSDGRDPRHLHLHHHIVPPVPNAARARANRRPLPLPDAHSQARRLATHGGQAKEGSSKSGQRSASAPPGHPRVDTARSSRS